ncbi:hypothetical protein Vp2S01_A0700 [Vibrio parahaemolyticus]|nr:hypothetical protein Vp2S01_A0700 [Vibrio parahaemolyticus]
MVCFFIFIHLAENLKLTRFNGIETMRFTNQHRSQYQFT